MLGRSSTHHPPEPPRLSEYLCRKSLEPRVSNLSLLQETMIRESHCITIQQFCIHLPYHTAMIKHNSYSKRYPASVIGVRSPRSLPARIAWYLMKFPLFILVIRALDTESSSLTTRKIRFTTSHAC